MFVLCLIVLMLSLIRCLNASRKVPPAEHLAISCHRTILELCRSVPKEVSIMPRETNPGVEHVKTYESGIEQ